MSSKPKTRIAFVLDRSGSMGRPGVKEEAIEGFNEQIEQLQEKAATHDLRCSLVTFNGEVYEHEGLWDAPPEALTRLTPETYKPFGATARRDALGYTLMKLAETERPDDQDTAYLVLVISDGRTNADSHFSEAMLAELIQACHDDRTSTGQKRWTISYIGHETSYVEELARKTGVPLANCAAWSNKSASSTKRCFATNKVRLAKYMDERRRGATASANYASDLGGSVADYDAELPQEQVDNLAPASISTPGDLSGSDNVPNRQKLKDLLNRMPKYTVTAGENQVQWSYTSNTSNCR